MPMPYIKLKDRETGKIYNMPVAVLIDKNNKDDINSYRYLNSGLLTLSPYYAPTTSDRGVSTYDILNDVDKYYGLRLWGCYGKNSTIKFELYTNAPLVPWGMSGYNDYYQTDNLIHSWGLQPPWGSGGDYVDIVQYCCMYASDWNPNTEQFDINANGFTCGFLSYAHNTLNDLWYLERADFSTSKQCKPQNIFIKAIVPPRYEDITDIDTGNENLDNASDSIIQETTTSLVGLGTIHTGRINESNISKLSDVFSSTDTVNFLKNYFVDVFDAIVSLMISPFSVEDSVVGTENTIKIFGHELVEVMYYPATKTIKHISCGVLHITPRFGNFMDFSPYSTYQIYIPYHGYVSLNADDVVDSDIELIYDVNIATGTFTAFVRCEREKNGISLNAILYQVSGNMYYSIPLSRADFRTYYANLNSSMYSLGSITLGAVGSASTGNAAGIASSALATANMVNNMEHSKVQLQRSGAVDTGSNLTTLRVPHIVINHANLSVPETLAKENGYYSNVSYTLSELEGFTKVKSINLTVSGCTDNERKEIEQLLKSGVII